MLAPLPEPFTGTRPGALGQDAQFQDASLQRCSTPQSLRGMSRIVTRGVYAQLLRFIEVMYLNLLEKRLREQFLEKHLQGGGSSDERRERECWSCLKYQGSRRYSANRSTLTNV